MKPLSFKRLTKLRESGKFCCVEIRSDYHYHWDLGLFKRGSNHQSWDIYDSDEDLDKVIFRVYKKASRYMRKGK